MPHEGHGGMVLLILRHRRRVLQGGIYKCAGKQRREHVKYSVDERTVLTTR